MDEEFSEKEEMIIESFGPSQQIKMLSNSCHQILLENEILTQRLYKFQNLLVGSVQDSYSESLNNETVDSVDKLTFAKFTIPIEDLPFL